MNDLRPIHPDEVEISSQRSKLIGAAVVVVGLGALGAYAFASGEAPNAAPQKVVTNQVRTTPEYSETMPPPVSPTPVTGKPVTPQPSKPQAQARHTTDDEASQSAMAQPKQPVAPPSPLQTPPENAPSQQDVQPSGPQNDQSAQETQSPDATQPQ